MVRNPKHLFENPRNKAHIGLLVIVSFWFPLLQTVKTPTPAQNPRQNNPRTSKESTTTSNRKSPFLWLDQEHRDGFVRQNCTERLGFPEPLLKKEAPPAVLGGREFWKCSGSLKCL